MRLREAGRCVGATRYPSLMHRPSPVTLSINLPSSPVPVFGLTRPAARLVMPGGTTRRRRRGCRKKRKKRRTRRMMQWDKR